MSVNIFPLEVFDFGMSGASIIISSLHVAADQPTLIESYDHEIKRRFLSTLENSKIQRR